MQNNTEKVIKGISSQTIVTIALGVVEILSFSIMSRLLTQEDFGYFAAITAITTVFTSFSETGIGSALIQKKEINSQFINNAFTLNLIFGTFISVLLFLIAAPVSRLVVDETLIRPIRMMSITLFCHCMVSVNFSLMRRKLQFLRVGLINLISLVVATVVAIIFAIKGYGFYAILAKSIVSSLLTLVLSYCFVHTNFSLALDSKVFKSIFRFSGWLMAGSVFRNLSGQVDRLMMGRLLSVTSLGTYNRPKEFINQIASKLNGIFDTALFPVLSGIQDDLNSLQRSFATSLYYLNIFASILTIGFIVNHELLIRIFLGSQWMGVGVIFIVFCFSLLFNIDGRLADCYLRSLGLTKTQFFFRVAETVMKIIGVYIGSKWDVIGVVICVVSIDVLMKVLKTCYVTYTIKMRISSSLSIMVSGWKSAVLVFIPCFILMFFLRHTFLGNILLLSVFLVFVALIFLLFPTLVGDRYKAEVYPKLTDLLKKKIRLIK